MIVKTPINIAGEGPTDVAVMRRLLSETGLLCGTVYHGEGRRTGKQSLDGKMRGYLAGAVHVPWFVLRDLDNDGCVVEVRHRLVGETVPPLLIFRIAIRTVDAWLMADRDALADHLKVRLADIPINMANHPEPKKALFASAARSKSNFIKKSVSPASLKGRKISSDFFETMIEFVDYVWRPDVAAQNSESLGRALKALKQFQV